jgi:hypothetical protein
LYCIIKQVALNKSSLLLKIIFAKHTNIVNIHYDCQTRKYLYNLLKMPSSKALVQRPSSLIKRKRGEAQALKVRLQNCLLKVENVFQE